MSHLELGTLQCKVIFSSYFEETSGTFEADVISGVKHDVLVDLFSFVTVPISHISPSNDRLVESRMRLLTLTVMTTPVISMMTWIVVLE